MPELAKQTWPQARQAIQMCGAALLPVGAIEQHGPHLPLGTDWFIAQHIAAQVARAPEWLLLPGIPVGVSHEHRQFWGTLTISADDLRAVVLATIRSAAGHGIKRFVLVNGHGTNCAPLDEAARLLRADGISVYVFNWWQAIVDTLTTLSLNPVDNAGPVETSLILAIDPELMRGEGLPDAAQGTQWGAAVEGVQVEFDAIRFTQAGNVGDPRLADAAKGRVLIDEAVARLTRFCIWLAARRDDHLAAAHKP
jgi:creatinine amidohydrolase